METMRQYERSDCLETGTKNQELEISRAYSAIHWILALYKISVVSVFGNPKNRKSVWLPYGSVVEIEGRKYRIVKGERIEGDRPGKFDGSSDCLLGGDKKLYYMENFEGKIAKVIKVKSKFSLPSI